MFSAKRIIHPLAVLLSLSVPLACDQDIESREGPGTEVRQLAVCNEAYEAEVNSENAVIEAVDWTKRKNHPGYNEEDGEGYMDAGGQSASLVWRFPGYQHELPPGTYNLTIHYANGSGDTRPVDIWFNDDEDAGIEERFEPTGHWASWKTTETREITSRDWIRSITISVKERRGGPNIDYIEISDVHKC